MNTVQFGDFEFDPGTAELRRSGLPVPLERQPALTLGVLVARPGRLVPRDDLRRAVWPSDVHVDFDRGLNYCVRQLRAALGDDAKAPRFIETIPRQGYRFVAPIATESEPLPVQPPTHRRRHALLAAAAVVLVGALGWDRASHDADRSARHHAVAVNALQALHDLVF